MSTQENFDKINIEKILKLIRRFNGLSGAEIKDLTGLPAEKINDYIDYMKNLGIVSVKGNDHPYSFSSVKITKDGIKLHDKKLLEGHFDA